MAAIKEIGTQDSLENKLFRFVAPFLFLEHFKKNLNKELSASFCKQNHHAKPISEVLESIDYEEFPSLSSVISYIITK